MSTKIERPDWYHWTYADAMVKWWSRRRISRQANLIAPPMPAICTTFFCDWQSKSQQRSCNHSRRLPWLVYESLVNRITHGRPWRDLELDGLILTAYASGHSRNIPIERCWIPLSKWLTEVTLPRTLTGKDLPPLTPHNVALGEKKMEIFW